ncbi:MAG: ShlB/FhaC/HecB family hemolysin secretion/activation protein [Gammaproteobacteria bacterium]|nr:MAG: ShlB/FhaC/HecB family hemolysin secretion/activation protein [Gammaproteobacteria bacterium]RKZ44021.1 MAG: ShlB/FhaC/HecB family hemolysin secretion/activation protein [Gammaproteobacteria bacterium]RKZ76156.1 MAG: ShlB/FhaC/HecB family hemolysin secretion/activation protein [Gammaproteobacteria bacterium]
MKNNRYTKPYHFSPFLFFLKGGGILALLLTSLTHPLLAEVSNEFAQSAVLEQDNSSPLPGLGNLPPIEPGQLLSSLGSIKVKQFQFEDNYVFSDEELAEITRPYVKELSAEQLQDVKNEVTQFYIDKGYINSGAIIPDQKLVDGIVTIKIIEGTLLRVDVTGNEKLYSSYVDKRLKGKEGAALNINELQERLQMLQLNPRIQRIQAELGPGVKLGEGRLKINVVEDSPHQFEFVFNNYRSPSIGGYRGEIKYWHHNVTGSLMGKGWGDTLYLRYGLTEGLKDVTLRYDIPLNHHDTTLSFNIERSDSEVVEEPFKKLDVESEADTYAITLRHPLIQKPQEAFDLALRLEKRMSKTFILSQPFSFSPGVQKGETDLSVIRFSQEWVRRSSISVIAARSSLNFGIDALDSTINDDGSPDSQFFTWLGQFQYVGQLNFFKTPWLNNSRIIFRTDFQWAREDLLPLEKLSIGGATTVRGYRENLLTRDNGLISSLEWRIPIYGQSKDSKYGKVEFTPFIDYGRSWNTDIDTPEPKDIYSAGLGVRWKANENIHAQLYWGYALRDVPEQEDKDLQDNGVHFGMSVLF